MRKPTAVVAAASLLLLAGCADLEDHPIERAQDSPAGMEYAPDTDYPPDTAGWDTLHPRVPPVPPEP